MIIVLPRTDDEMRDRLRETVWRRLTSGLAGLWRRATGKPIVRADGVRPGVAWPSPTMARAAWAFVLSLLDGRGAPVEAAHPGLCWLAAMIADGRHAASPQPTPSRRPDFDEAALIAQAQAGHLPAFNQLILHYQSLVYNVAYRVMGDETLAEDATQEAFLKAYQRVHQYRGGSFKAWLLRIVTNTCYDVLRARRRRPTVSLEKDDDEEDADADYNPWLVDRSERPDSFVMRQELAGVIQEAIGRLPPDQRTTLILADIEGLDYQEIADVMGTALGTVKSRLSRARAKMRDMLMAHQELLPSQYRLSGD